MSPVRILALALSLGAIGLEWPGTGALQSLVDAASPGATIKLPEGEFAGPLLVDKPLTILGGGKTTIVFEASSRGGDALRLFADGISVSGLEVRGSGSSLKDLDAAIHVRGRGVRIEDCRVRDSLFGIRVEDSDGVAVSGCDIEGRRSSAFALRGDGIRVSASALARVEDTRLAYVCDGVYLDGLRSPQVARCSVSEGRYGVHVMYGSGAHIESVRAERTVAGFMVMDTQSASLSRCSVADGRDPRSAALALFESRGCTVEDGTFSGCQTGISLDSAMDCLISGNLVEDNARGIVLGGGGPGTVIAGNAFVGNGCQVYGASSAALVSWTRDGKGNYWDDYRGYDTNGDGIGDSPYRRQRGFSSLVARTELATIFFGSPLQRAMDDLELDAEVVDKSPSTRRPAGLPTLGGAFE
jgi:nitrous oxidase accessory protein